MKIKLLYTVIIVLLFLISNVSFGQSVNIDTVANYSFFASIVVLSNSDAHNLPVITGDEGTKKANTISGFENEDHIIPYVCNPRSALIYFYWRTTID